MKVCVTILEDSSIFDVQRHLQQNRCFTNNWDREGKTVLCLLQVRGRFRPNLWCLNTGYSERSTPVPGSVLRDAVASMPIASLTRACKLAGSDPGRPHSSMDRKCSRPELSTAGCPRGRNTCSKGFSWKQCVKHEHDHISPGLEQS